jgi:hypothetical protein
MRAAFAKRKGGLSLFNKFKELKMKDLHSNIHTTQVVAPVSHATGDAAIVGAIIDRANFDSLEYSINLGTNAATVGAYAVTLEHGDNSALSDATTVAAPDLSGTTANASWAFGDVNKTRKIGYVGSKRYTRMTITPTGNNGAFLVGVTAIQADPVNAPTANPPQ